MRHFFVTAICAVAAAAMPGPAFAQSPSPLAGVWTLNRSLSEFPPDIGFDITRMLPPAEGQGSGSSGGGRGRRGGGSAPPYTVRRESSEDAHRGQLLTAEARNPPARLMVVDTANAITITDEVGQSRTLHPGGKEEPLELQGTPLRVTTRREADRLVVLYSVDQDRAVQYTYSHSANPSRLIVEVQFLEHGSGDKARRVYEPGIATETLSPPATAPDSSAGRSQPTDKFDERPGAELRELKDLGILVEDLSTQAVGCGLDHDAIETALSKRLTSAGFTVRRNSDEDTYLYVNIMTTTVANGICVSRYDAFLYTHATANVSYRDQPVLVQVSLIHRGGIGSSAPVAHATAVTRGLENYVDLFVTQIRDANK
jgi:hypothetical protein